MIQLSSDNYSAIEQAERDCHYKVVLFGANGFTEDIATYLTPYQANKVAEDLKRETKGQALSDYRVVDMHEEEV